MKNIVFHYLYRDGANYKNLKSVVFENPSEIELSEMDNLIRNKIICGSYFYANEWSLPDLHFGSWDDEIDHTLHEFECIEYTKQPANSLVSLLQFIDIIKATDWV